MAVLITGGKGFVGKNLSAYLKAKGHEIVLFEGDITDKKNIESFKYPGQIDVVVHLAGVVDKKDDSLFEKVNTNGTQNIAALCKKINADRLIFSSSIRVVSGFDDPYSKSKMEAERVVVDSGVPYVILRPSIIYGPGDKKNIGFLLKLAQNLPIMPVFGFKMQPLFAEDFSRIISASFKIPANQIINLTGPEAVSFKEFLSILKSLGFKFFVINWPRFFNLALRFFSYFPFSPFRPWQAHSLLDSGIVKSPDFEKLFVVKPTSLKDGLKKTIDTIK